MSRKNGNGDWIGGERKTPLGVVKVRQWILEMHQRPHLDENFAMWLIEKFGEEKFPGISAKKNQTIFTSSGEKSGISLGAGNIVPIGVGRGLFDEHIDNGGVSDRMTGECSATLIAKYLGIREKPELQKMLDYVLKHDSTGNRRNFDIADFTIALNRKYSDKEVIKEMSDIFDALYELKEEPDQKDRDILAQVIESWIRKSRIPGEVSQQIRKFVNLLKNGGLFDFDLTTIFIALTQKLGLEIATEKVEMFLTAKYQVQISFNEAIEEVRDPEITSRLIVNRNDQRYVVIVGKSDNRDYGRAARFVHKDLAIVIQRKKSGRTFVFGNNGAPIKNEISKIMAIIRVEEMLQRGQIPIIDYRKMSSAGTLDQVPNWHLLRGGDSVGQILNGSDDTASDIEPTRIQLKTIVKFTTMVLKLGNNLNWNRYVKNALRVHS